MSDDPAPSLRPFGPGDGDWLRAVHLDHYQRVEGFDASFAAAVDSAIASLHVRAHDPRSLFQIAEAGGVPRGSLFLAPDDHHDAAGRLRLFYLDPALRGSGLGGRMLDRALDHARAMDLERVVVSTFTRHAAALTLYHRRGFAEERRRPVHAFGQALEQVDLGRGLA
ncbi:GNAT family N-acetyltransferase [Palleronia pelagia]|uniref:Acetyltransferase (GNAT) family protein n=1 Tax=Palleronia pelagia TaxID=387096 RepID=A0A1H8B8Y3_9RHOB|nr:GNAT family N-acetyltransferase [Palleronia pelagia]SEM79156.1 Acetyltransferase (GNAT) family protein [Palleronia pelagia]